MDEDDFKDESLDELEQLEQQNANGNPYGKKARELYNKRKDSKNAAKSAGEKGKNAAKKTASEVKKDTANKIRQKAAKETISAGAAAATGGTSKAAELGIDAALKASDKIDQKISEKLGVSKTKFKIAKNATIISLPVILIIALVISFITIFDLLTVTFAAEELGQAIDEIEEELGKDMLRFTDAEFTYLIDSIKNKYEVTGYPVTSYLGKLVTTFDSDEEKSSLDKALEAMEKYFRAEKSNFNKIKWVVVNGENGEKKDPIMYETYDRLQLPKTDVNYFGNGVFPAIQEDGTINTFKGYLQTWIIPLSMHISSSNAYFAQNVIDQMYHEVNAQVYLLNKYTKNTTVNLTLETESYQESYTCNATGSGCPNGYSSHTSGSASHTRTAYRVKEPYVIKSVNSYNEGELIKTPDSVATFINYAETYKGIVSSPVVLDSKSDSTYTKSEGGIRVTGSISASGATAERIDTETWRDLAKQEEEVIEAYELTPGKKVEELTTNRIQAFLENPEYGYTDIKYELTSLMVAFDETEKIHEDVLKEAKAGTINKDVWVSQSLAWPVPNSTLVGDRKSVV